MSEAKPATRANATLKAERRDEAARHIIDMERAATDAKTAKLRALRLAKEAQEPPAVAPKAAPRARKPKVVRVT
jgi:hypothetical protein